LPFIPRRRVRYREMELDEMDLPAILHRAPELCLIDELAHTNAPGLEHAKRYQDIDDVLDAGIDVFSTVNVQHLESLNDRVAELTGVRVRETFPDAVLASADEVVLMDLTPEALLQRLREGKVYSPERIQTALNSFFKVENLSALREVALRQVAEEVESRRLVTPAEALGTREEKLFGDAPQAVQERVLALVTPEESSQRLVRRAWRSAQRLGGDLDLLYVAPPGEPPRGQARQRLEELRRLATLLDADLIVEEGDDLVEAAAHVAAERGTTYVFMGQPRRRGALGRVSEWLPERLMRRLPGVDVRIVADPRA
jgi:two-component system sensor histidine kinase KdpD